MKDDIEKLIKTDILKSFVAYMKIRKKSIEYYATKLNIDSKKLSAWIKGKEMPTGDEIAKIENRYRYWFDKSKI